MPSLYSPFNGRGAVSISVAGTGTVEDSVYRPPSQNLSPSRGTMSHPAPPEMPSSTQYGYSQDSAGDAASTLIDTDADAALLARNNRQPAAEFRRSPDDAPSSNSNSSTLDAVASATTAASQRLLAQRFAAAVAADRSERLVRERLLLELSLLQEERRRLERECKEGLVLAPPPAAPSSSSLGEKHGYNGEAFLGSLRPQDVPSGGLPSDFPQGALAIPSHRGYEPPCQGRQQRPYRERPHQEESRAFVSSSQVSVPPPSSSDGDDERARVLEAAEACMALSGLGGFSAGSQSVATSVAAKKEEAQQAPIVSPGASPSPPLSQSQLEVGAFQSGEDEGAGKAMNNRKNTTKAKKINSDAAVKNMSSSGGPLKKRKKMDEDVAAKDEKSKHKGKKSRKKEEGMPKINLDAAAKQVSSSSGPLKKRKKMDEDAAAKDEGGKPKGKKSRKKEEGMPRRPLSAYNIFFSEERQRILQEIPADGENNEGEDLADKQAAALQDISSNTERIILDRRHSDATSRLQLPPQEASNAEQCNLKRRKHRRTHGKIGFRDLAKTIGQRWKTLPPEKMERYRSLAKVDMERYQEELALFRRTKLIKEAAAAVEAGTR
eukprot:CAMPEP_0197466152 /NCGR_PEP_ID=MMETSP1175-20131217/64903_1 /TAXON_ID=1003142 /ORGANISM="Triceratium dubium, Strain CCMP147" /LENGTH=604 /DNA_ID=CAMNT_0043002183 /DNA_START=374 /DNA_END=2191 /DNA_ORIENTATION=-